MFCRFQCDMLMENLSRIFPKRHMRYSRSANSCSSRNQTAYIGHDLPAIRNRIGIARNRWVHINRYRWNIK